MPIDRPFPRGLDDLVGVLQRELHRVEGLCDRLGPDDAHQLKVFLELTREALRMTAKLDDSLLHSMYHAQYCALMDEIEAAGYRPAEPRRHVRHRRGDSGPGAR